VGLDDRLRCLERRQHGTEEASQHAPTEFPRDFQADLVRLAELGQPGVPPADSSTTSA